MPSELETHLNERWTKTNLKSTNKYEIITDNKVQKLIRQDANCQGVFIFIVNFVYLPK